MAATAGPAEAGWGGLDILPSRSVLCRRASGSVTPRCASSSRWLGARWETPARHQEGPGSLGGASCKRRGPLPLRGTPGPRSRPIKASKFPVMTTGDAVKCQPVRPACQPGAQTLGQAPAGLLLSWGWGLHVWALSHDAPWVLDTLATRPTWGTAHASGRGFTSQGTEYTHPTA